MENDFRASRLELADSRRPTSNNGRCRWNFQFETRLSAIALLFLI
jgi:hypothetical protein